MTLNLSIPKEFSDLKPRITVIGVGGAGGNAVNNMIRANLVGCEFVACNTDAQALQHSLAERKIQLGQGVTRGLGAGSRPDVGRAAAEEVIDEIMAHLHGSNLVFITAGMGGGTGTGAAPVIARAARENGILTVGVVTKPFHFEGTHRMRLADSGIEELQKFVDTLLIIPNQNLFRVASERTTFADAFKMADDVLHSGVRGVTDLMVMPGLINLDFSDIRTVMSEMGKAMMGTGEAEGENRALEAAEAAISNPLLDDVSMKGARGVLINITGGMDMTLFEVDEAANRIREEVDPEANIIFGSTFDDRLSGKIRISVVATGIDAEPMAMPVGFGHTRTAAAPTLTVIETRTPEPIVAAPFAARREAEPESLNIFISARQPTMAASETGEAVRAEAPVAELSRLGGEVVNGSFIPPRPVAAGPGSFVNRGTPTTAEADRAAGERSAVKPAAPKPQPSLLQRIIGAGRTLPQQPAAPTVRAAGLQTAPRFDAAPAAAVNPMAETFEEDLHDIPAFLRRQAN
jgi:cell division protein FtsZ